MEGKNKGSFPLRGRKPPHPHLCRVFRLADSTNRCPKGDLIEWGGRGGSLLGRNVGVGSRLMEVPTGGRTGVAWEGVRARVRAISGKSLLGGKAGKGEKGLAGE